MVRRCCRLIVALSVALVVSQTLPSAQGADPFLGTWKVNVAKSKYDPGPPPKALSRTNVDRGTGVMLATTEGTDLQGTGFFIQTAFKFDGQDYPVVVKGSQNVNMISVKRPDRYSFEYTVKVDGKAVTTTSGTVTKDGKTLTERTKGTNPLGQPVNDTVIWEKQ